MKKYLIAAFFLGLSILAVPTAFAQNKIDLAKVDYRYNALLEFFLQKTTERDYQTAYGLLAGNFAQLTLEDFIHIVNELGLTTFTERKWTSFKDEMKSIGVTTVTGDFTTPDGVVHHLTFFVILGGETEIKVGYITETVDVAALAKRFPAAEALGQLVQRDARQVATFVRKNRVRQAYKYLSVTAQTKIKMKDIRKAFRAFKKLKLDVAFPKKAQAALSGEPALNESGQMVVSGAYRNKKNNVNFTLLYDYEDWKWKLGVFALTAQPFVAAQ